MQLHDLKPAPGAHRKADRVGRGTGSGRGKTSGRGQKGQNARSQGFRLGFADGTKVDVETLVEAGLVHPGKEVKILGTGGIKRKLTVEAHFFSSSAREAIEKSGGSVKVLGEPRKIGERRTAAKAPKPLPAAEGPRAAAESEAPKPQREQ